MTLKDHSLKQEPKPVKVSPVDLLIPQIENLSEAELADLRHQIDLRLHLDLSKLDLSEELALQFRQAKALLHEVQGDNQTPVNQKSQLFNSARAQLSDIVNQQKDVWSMERLKKIEAAVVKACNLMTEEQKAAFMDLYGVYLKAPDAAAASV